MYLSNLEEEICFWEDDVIKYDMVCFLVILFSEKFFEGVFWYYSYYKVVCCYLFCVGCGEG